VGRSGLREVGVEFLFVCEFNESECAGRPAPSTVVCCGLWFDCDWPLDHGRGEA